MGKIDLREGLVNVNDFVITEPQQVKQLPFSVEQDLKPSDYENLKKYFLDFKSNNLPATYHAEMTFCLNFLYPNKLEELAIDNFLSNAFLFDLVVSEDPSPVIELAAALLSLTFPEKADQFCENFCDSPNLYASEIARAVRENVVDDQVLDFCFLRKAFSPGSLKLEIPMYEKAIEQANESDEDELAKIKLIFLHLFSEKFESDFWDRAKEKLAQFRENGSWLKFAEHAMSLKILAAEKVQIDSDGLHIIDPSPQAKQIPAEQALPEVRSF